jgi:large repetitive protein
LPIGSEFGQSATFTATVNSNTGSGTPTGTATFSVNGGAGTPVTLSGGKATFTTSTLPVGPDTITVTYGGDSNFNGSTNSAVQRIDQSNSTIALASSQNPSALGQSVTFTATVSAVPPGMGTPTGSVTFVDQTTSQTLATVALIGGKAAFTISTLTGGGHLIEATYGGDTNFGGSGPAGRLVGSSCQRRVRKRERPTSSARAGW